MAAASTTAMQHLRGLPSKIFSFMSVNLWPQRTWLSRHVFERQQCLTELPFPLQILTPVFAFTEANQVCVCSCVVDGFGWKATSFSWIILGCPRSVHHLAMQAAAREAMGPVVMNAEGRMELVKQRRQRYRQTWNWGLMLYVLQANEGSHNSVRTSAGLQTSGTNSAMCRTLTGQTPNPSHSCYRSPWATQSKVGGNQSCN